MRQSKAEILYDEEMGRRRNNSPPENAAAFIEWLNGHIESVPTEFRDTVTIEITAENGWPGCDASPCVKVYYTRPETDAEMDDREKAAKHVADVQRRLDLAEFEKLKQRLGVS